MSYSYDKTIGTKSVVPSVLKTELEDEGFVSGGGKTAIIEYVSTDGETDTCSMVFDTEPTSSEKTIIDTVYTDHEGIPGAATLRVGGGLIIEPLDTPSAPTCVAQGTTGSTDYEYKVSAFSDTGESLASSETLVSNGNAVLSFTNFNRISWDAVEGAIKYAVYRSLSDGTPSSTGKLKETTLLQLDDTGLTASGAEPSEDLSGGLVVGTGTVSSSKAATIKELTSDQSTVTSLLRLARRTSGVAAAGFGTGIYLALDDAGGTLRDVGSLHFRWDNPAAATLHSKARIQLRDGGSEADKTIEWHHDGKMTVLGDTVLEKTTCVIGFPLSGGLTGGNASSSSNNTIASILLDDVGESRIRWNFKPPKNYASGDMTLKLRCSTSNPTSADMRMELRWQTLADGDSLPSSYPNISAQTVDLNGEGGDTLFDIDFTLGSSTFDVSDDMMAMYLLRDGDHADDTTTLSLHVHQIELHYTGWAFAGQAGQ